MIEYRVDLPRVFQPVGAQYHADTFYSELEPRQGTVTIKYDDFEVKAKITRVVPLCA